MVVKGKEGAPILIRNKEAILLSRLRAKREHRPIAQAASVTIIEFFGKQKNDGPRE
jgi:hypothetical protein